MGDKLSPVPLSRLGELREIAGLSHGAVAQAVGCSRAHYTHVERGTRAASLDLALRLARLFGTTVDAIFGGLLDPQRRAS